MLQVPCEFKRSLAPANRTDRTAKPSARAAMGAKSHCEHWDNLLTQLSAPLSIFLAELELSSYFSQLNSCKSSPKQLGKKPTMSIEHSATDILFWKKLENFMQAVLILLT